MEKAYLVIVWKVNLQDISGYEMMKDREDGCGIDLNQDAIRYIGKINQSKIKDFIVSCIKEGVHQSNIQILDAEKGSIRFTLRLNPSDIVLLD